MQKRNLFERNENVEEEIAKIYGTTKKSINEDVNKIQQWIKTQPHLPEVMEQNAVRFLLTHSKCSFEETKHKIDCYYTFKSRWVELYENINPKLSHMKMVLDATYWLPLPKLTGNIKRVFVFKIRDSNLADEVEHRDLSGHLINLFELGLREDYTCGVAFIFDLSQIKKEYIRKVSYGLLLKMSAVFNEVFHIHIEGIYVLNAPQFVDSFFAYLKTLLKPKILERTHFCKTNEELLEFFPKQILPSDYGGEEKSLEELNDIMKEKFLQYQDLFDKIDNMKVDEKLRPLKLKNDEFLGFHGNFKKLDVD